MTDLVAVRALPGVERLDFVNQPDPPRAGATIYFASREAYEPYREERLPELQRQINASWGKGLAFEHVFEREGGRGQLRSFTGLSC